ncbi:MAG: type II toxin-antitoxin system RelE/ParE family toxin [Pirellulaceae bacterium]
MNQPDLTSEQQQALQQGHGFVQGASYILMTVEFSDRARNDIHDIVDYIQQDSPAAATNF